MYSHSHIIHIEMLTKAVNAVNRKQVAQENSWYPP